MPKGTPESGAIDAYDDTIMDESDFSDYDRVEPSRLSDRIEQHYTPHDEDGQEETRPRVANPFAQWLERPSMPDQAARFPTTVRAGHSVTEVFDLSNKEELAGYNELQRKAESEDGPLIEIIINERQFDSGRFYALVTYRKLTYQKL